MLRVGGERHRFAGHDVADDVDQDRRDDDAFAPGKATRAGRLDAASSDGGRAHDLAKLRAGLSGMNGGGAALPASAAAKFSTLLGSDLSAVRIHTDSQLAAGMGVRALTHGSNIAFAPGAYDEGNAEHDPVLAHELAHVVQNQRGGAPMEVAARLDIGPSNTPVENEAEAASASLMSGRPFSVASHASLPGISMFSGPDPAPTSSAPKQAPPPPNPAVNQTPANQAPADQTQNQGAKPTPTAATPTPTATPKVDTPPPANGAGGAPAAPDLKPGAQTPPPAATGAVLDSKVMALLEQRADPKAKGDYATTMGAFVTLRLSATQYSFVNSNIGHTLLQMVWPSDALGDHWGQIGKLNQYRGDDGDGVSFWGGVQRGIEGLRGILHILGDLAAALSAIAGAVAIASAAVGAVCAISVIGLAGPAEVAAGIAAIADAVATAAALVKIAADIIDMILGFFQMLILVFRARAAKGDPAARARFAQLLHKEAGDFAGNLVGVAVQIGVLLATAGAGAGGAKGLAKMTMKDVSHEFEKLLPREALKSLKNDLPSAMKLITRGVADTKAGVRIGAKEVVRAGVAPGGKVVLTAEEEMAKLSVLARQGKRAIKAPGGGKVRKLVDFTLDPPKGRGTITVLNTAKVHYVGIKNAGGISAAGQTTQFIVDTKAPAAGGSGPSSGAGEIKAPGTPVAGSLATVQMWPTQLAAFKTEQNLIPNVKEHVEEQYKNAQAQAGPELAALFDKKLTEALEKRNATKQASESVKTDAAGDKAQADQGAATAKQGADAKQKGDANNAKLQQTTTTITTKGDSLKTPPAKDGIGNWIYNHSIGYLGQALGWVQNGIKNNLGKFLFYLAGYDSQELDFAGIEGDMRTAAQSDTKSSADAASAATAVDPVQKAVVEMQTDKTTSQQQAIQGMADAKNFIEALEEANTTLLEAIANGEAYMQAAAPLLQHEAETKNEGKSIDAAYLQPALAYADAIAASVPEDNGPAIASEVTAQFQDLHAKMPGVDITAALGSIQDAQTAHHTRYAEIITNGHAAADKVKGALQAFVGTKDYDGVNANAAALDKLADDMAKAVGDADQAMVDAINAMIDQYNTAIQAEFDKLQQSDPNVAPTTTDPNAPPPTDPNTPPDPNANPPVDRKADGNGVSAGADKHVEEAAGASGGTALPAPLRDELERSLGADLGDVRIHTGGKSATAAKSVGAKAYTTGRDIHFAEGAYDPSSKTGRALIAHEVAHVVQQRGGSVAAGTRQHKLDVSAPGDTHEKEADAFAESFVAKGSAFSQLSAAGPSVARRPDPRPPNTVAPYSADNFKTATASVKKSGAVQTVEAMRAGDDVLLQTPGVSMMATVALKDDIDPDVPINVGWVQTVESSKRLGIYEKNGRVVRRTVTAFSRTRDGKTGVDAPWYETPSTITKDAREAYPLAEDQPKMKLPNRVEDATLAEVQGSDDFKVSLEAGPGTTVSPLKTFAWSAPWSVRLGSADTAKGGDVSIAESTTHEPPRGMRTANQVGNDPDSTIKSYETEAEATQGLAAKGIHGFLRELPRHKELLPSSYWNMVGALWKSSVKFKVTITPIEGGSPSVRVSLQLHNKVDLPEADAKEDHSALGHMVYDPGKLAPGDFVYVFVNGVSRASITFPFDPVSVKDVKEETGWSTYVYNIDVKLE